jgi:hypothetical protein
MFDISLRPYLTRPRNPISARAVRMSGVFTVAMGQNPASQAVVKIADNRIALRLMRLPGTRGDGVMPRGATASFDGRAAS